MGDLDLGLFRIVQKIDEKNEKTTIDRSKVFSINELIEKGPKFLKNLIFTTKSKVEDQDKEEFTYV